MEIMIGIEDSAKESDIERLAEAGATEFFCGIMPRDWVSIYNYQISLNKREWQANQFHSFDKLSAATKKIHLLKRKIVVAFNAHYYTREQIALIKKYLDNLKDIGVDALIVGNIPLLLLVRDLGINIPIYISGEAGAYNYRALQFYKKYNVKRILFPRDMSTDEMSRIIKKGAAFNLEYEAFAMSERCVFSAGYCRTSHGYSNSNFCNQGWKKDLYLRLPGDYLNKLGDGRMKSVDEVIPKPSLKIVKNWYNNAAMYRAFTDCNFFPSSTMILTFWGGCGLCSVSKLKEIGITSLKIVSRGSKLDSKLSRLKIINQVLQNEIADAEFPIKIKNTRELCDLGYACYYRETRGKNG